MSIYPDDVKYKEAEEVWRQETLIKTDILDAQVIILGGFMKLGDKWYASITFSTETTESKFWGGGILWNGSFMTRNDAVSSLRELSKAVIAGGLKMNPKYCGKLKEGL